MRSDLAFSLHVAVISDFLKSGGAAIAATRITAGMEGAGARISRIAGDLPTTPDSRRLLHLSKEVGFRRRLATGPLPVGRLMRAMDSWEGGRQVKWMKRRRVQAIHMHNIHYSMLSPDFLRPLIAEFPVVWTLHDMWSFTGRCAYAYDCRLFESRCTRICPTPSEYPALRPSRIAAAHESKQKLLCDAENLVAVCPSRWLAKEAVGGGWPSKRVRVIPNGLDLELFRPVDVSVARATLGLPQSGQLMLLSAQAFDERRKGADLLPTILSVLRKAGIGVVTFGNHELPDFADLNCYPLGHVSETLMPSMYAACDLLIHPAPVDNLPNTVVEAMACGTPTVAVNTGGLGELVLQGETGMLAPSTETFGETLRQALDPKLLAQWRPKCRDLAIAEHDIDARAGDYLRLLESI